MESIYALSMLDLMQHKDFTQTLRRFDADCTQNGVRNRSRIVAESSRHQSRILAECICALSMLDFMQDEDFTQISRKMGYEILAES